MASSTTLYTQTTVKTSSKITYTTTPKTESPYFSRTVTTNVPVTYSTTSPYTTSKITTGTTKTSKSHTHTHSHTHTNTPGNGGNNGNNGSKGSNSSPSPSPRDSLVPSDTLSTGAIAGIAIGTFVLGALLASLIVFCLLRRKNSRPSPQSPPKPRYAPVGGAAAAAPPGQSPSDSEKGAYAADSPVAANGGAGVAAAAVARPGSIEDLLPQPAETKHLAGELSKLQMLIRNHVGNFYSDQYIDPARLAGMVSPDALAEVASSSSLPASMWLEVLANTATRRAAIQYALSSVILSRVQPSSLDISKTLLPLTVVGCLQAMNGPSAKTKDNEYLKAKWHALTAHLQRDTYVKAAFSPADDRNENLENTLSLLNAVLGPLATPGTDAARASNLDAILKFAASLGLTLVSEPASWAFNWLPPKNAAPSKLLIVFPTLVQYADENGRAVARPLEIGEREVAHNISLP